MTTRELRVEIVGDSKSLEKALGNVSSASTKTSKSFNIMKGAALGAAGVIGGALVVGLKRGWEEMLEAQKVSAQTEAVLKSTGGQANVTAKDVETLATSLSKMSGVDDEAIQSGENLLLTFTNIRNEVGKGNNIFDRATGAILDMSVALGQDISSSAIQLGKALNDPIKGITALRRVGVSFTASQIALIKSMVDSGNTMGAQKLILRELNKEFGGSAKAAGETLPGQINKLKNAFDEASAALIERAIPYIMEFMEAVQGIFNAIQPILPIVQLFGKYLIDNMLAPIRIVAALLQGDWSAAWDAAKAPILDLVNLITTIFGPAIAAIGPLVDSVVGFFTALPGRIAATFADLGSTAIEPFKAAFTGAKNWVEARINDVVKFFTNLPGRIFATVAGLVSTALTPFQEAFATAKKFIGNRIDDVVTFFTNLPGRIFSTIANLVTSALTPFQNAFTTIKTFIAGVIDDVVDFFVKLPGRIAATIANLVSTGLNPFKRAFETSFGVVVSLLEDAKSAIKWLGEKAGGVISAGLGAIQAAVSGVTDAFGPLADIIGGIVSAVRWLIENIPKIPKPDFGGGGGGVLDPLIDPFRRAKGGPVRRGQMYVVGEKGPELFVPGAAGSIAPSSMLKKIQEGLSQWTEMTFGGAAKVTSGPLDGLPIPDWANRELFEFSARMALALGKFNEFMDGVATNIRSNARLLDLLSYNRTRWNWTQFPDWIGRILDTMRSLALSGAEAAPMFGLARGGIVTAPTRALIGEAGPEAVVPLSRYRGGMGGKVVVNIGTVVGTPTRAIADAWATEIDSALARKRGRTGALALD